MKWPKPVIEDGYRYVLPIKVSEKKSELAVIQINPSLADGKRLDPTAGKVKKWAEEKGYGIVYLLNFFALISSKQLEIKDQGYSWVVGRENDYYISKIPLTSEIVIATGEPKGVLKKYYLKRKEEIKSILSDRKVQRVGRLSGGKYPRHGRSWNLDNRNLYPYDWN